LAAGNKLSPQFGFVCTFFAGKERRKTIITSGTGFLATQNVRVFQIGPVRIQLELANNV
jgi:hypothetical protein